MKQIELNGKKVEIASTVDTVGLFCPVPIMKLKLEMENIAQGQVAELLADDEGVLHDLPAWCKETGNRLLFINKNKEDIFVAYVRKEAV